MSYDVIATPRFKRDIKKLVKKYPSLKQEFAVLFSLLKTDPEQGKNLGNQCFKIRLAIASIGKGKSGGARIITHIVIDNQKVFLLTIYDKSEKETISDKDLQDLLNQTDEL